MDLETERTVRGLNKERNVQCLLLSREFAAYRRCAGESWLARWCLMAPSEGRWPFLRRSKIAYLGWAAPPYTWRGKVSGLRRTPAAANPRTIRVSAGDRENHGEVPPPPCTTSRIASPERKLCYFRNSPLLYVFARHPLYHGRSKFVSPIVTSVRKL